MKNYGFIDEIDGTYGLIKEDIERKKEFRLLEMDILLPFGCYFST